MTDNKKPTSLKFKRFKNFIHPLLIKLMSPKATGELEVLGRIFQL